MTNPFKLTGPTCLSFSGGRTSAYMLWLVIQANTPEELARWLVVCFANTGCEDEATLRFVLECGRRWGIKIVWVEYRNDDTGFAVVDFGSAARAGEPFEAIIRKRDYLPNPVTRFCTSELKIRTMHKYLRSLGWHDGDDGWDQFIGIRADEQRRVAKIRARGTSTESSKEAMCMPLADAGKTLQDVDAFWKAQDFNLELPTYNGRTLAGNCDLCFLKPAKQVQSLIAERPERAAFWIRMEAHAATKKERWTAVPVMFKVLRATAEYEADLEAHYAEGGDDYDEPQPYRWVQLCDERGEPIFNLEPVKSDGWRFRSDRPSYQKMLDYVTQQRDMFGRDDEEGIPCFCGD